MNESSGKQKSEWKLLQTPSHNTGSGDCNASSSSYSLEVCIRGPGNNELADPYLNYANNGGGQNNEF